MMFRNSVVCLTVLFVLFGTSSALWVVAKEGEKKCFVEEVPKDTVVMTTFRAEHAPTKYRDVEAKKHGFVATVKDSQGNVILEKAVEMQGRIAFTSETEGDHYICFHTNSTRWLGGGKRFNVHVKIDVADEAIDYDQVAKAYSFNNAEVQAYQLTQMASGVQRVQSYLKHREYRMRNTNESTNSRVAWFAIFKISVLVSTALWQVLYLRRFFKSKKVV